LKSSDKLPTYIIYTLPPESVMSIIEEVLMFDINVNIMIPLKNISVKRKQYDKIKISVTQGCNPKPYHVNLIVHDHLRHCHNELPGLMGDSIMIFDEVHLFLNQSLRTGIGMNLSNLSHSFISFTGTPVIDNKTEKLIGWLEQIVPFEVNKKNFWVAANNMISKKITTGIRTETHNLLAYFTPSEQARYQKFIPPAMGGTNTNPSARDWMKAADVCYETCDRVIIKQTNDMIKNGRGVMIVTRDTNHQEKMRDMIIVNTELNSKDIFLITKDKSIFLTDESVKKKKTPDYKVVIVTKRKAQGYTLTRLSVMLTSVYPSNNATREQLAGRINRLGQKTEPLLYKTIHVGILTTIMKNHNSAKSLSAALNEMTNYRK
jgi:superfamily II DNA or RNA helicase